MKSFWAYVAISTVTLFSMFLEPASAFREWSDTDLLSQSLPVTEKVRFLNGIWEGSYTCRQGLTRLRLIIRARSTTEINAIFHFSAHPDNLRVPSGQFRMRGSLDVIDSQDVDGILYLQGTTWIDQPSGYSTVDLRGNVSSSRQRISGEILAPGCSTFDVIKREF